MAERKYRHPQVNLRLPEDLKTKVAELAASNGRSANAEMVAAIEHWVSSNSKPEPQQVTDELDELRARLDVLEKLISEKGKAI